ncbi:MAG: hypothetical protein LBJ09_01155 [Clostridiales bacterium]|jgi:hypothetical protein|nr:hypothetical protein [Clostridiales bacterium]
MNKRYTTYDKKTINDEIFGSFFKKKKPSCSFRETLELLNYDEKTSNKFLKFHYSFKFFKKKILKNYQAKNVNFQLTLLFKMNRLMEKSQLV